MKKKFLIASSTILCILAFFAMHQAILTSSQVKYTPGDTVSITTNEGVEFTETITGPTELELYTNYIWTLRFEITSNLFTFENIIVEETLPSELEIDHLIALSQGNVKATYPPGAIVITWTFDFLIVGIMDYMALNISTDLNPAGHQEFTSCGCYNLTSGPRLTYYLPAEGEGEPTKYKYSDWDWVWEVCIPCEGVSLFSDALRILPIVIVTGSIVIHRRKR